MSERNFTDGFRVLGKEQHRPAPLVVPRMPVIPIIFLPGIMGSNLRVKPSCVVAVRRRFEEEGRGDAFTDQAWRPPSLRYSHVRSISSALWESAGGNCQTVRVGRTWEGYGPKLRQVLLNPETVEVDDQGLIPHFIPGMLTIEGRFARAVARERGWGSVHWDSYWKILTYLETHLNPWFGLAPADGHLRRMHLEQARVFSEAFDNLQSVQVTDAEVTKVVQNRYPVHAMGYNWAQSNQRSAEEVLNKIQGCVRSYQARDHPCRQVILVTHSMGGLVARVTSQLAPPGLILGVVHGVMPATGAPVAYRRMVAGTEHDSPKRLKELKNVFSAIAGRTAAETTPVMANAPGALELLPSHLYPSKWLRVERERQPGAGEVLLALPNGNDPYGEIYQQREAWWRMVDPALLDPAGIGSSTERGDDPEAAWTKYLGRIDGVKEFHHSKVSTGQYHQPSHYFYGERVRTFASVCWQLPAEPAGLAREVILKARPCPGEGLGCIEIKATRPDAMTGKVVNGNMHFGTEVGLPALLQGPDGAGDGTVPVASGQAPAASIANGIAADVHGFDHGDAYLTEFSQVYTLLAICKLAGACGPF